MLRNVVSIVVFAGLYVGALFLSSGDWGWAMGWVYLVVHMGTGLISATIIASKHPELLAERYRPGEGAKAWDRLLGLATLVLLVEEALVAGFDRRFGWTPDLGFALQLSALVAWLAGELTARWAALSNRFYSRVVRIQTDRGHTVVTGGPYRVVRHPGYAGALLAAFAAPLMLGSLWALVPGGLLAVALVIRTALEDRVLLRELPGYEAYAQRTRYRLMPGLW